MQNLILARSFTFEPNIIIYGVGDSIVQLYNGCLQQINSANRPGHIYHYKKD
jgi:hypothetical protein